MSITNADMEHLKNLARLELNHEETLSLKDDLNKILESFEQIRHLDTSHLEELVRPISVSNVFREDIILPSLPVSVVEALANETENGFFKVPRTLDSDA